MKIYALTLGIANLEMFWRRTRYSSRIGSFSAFLASAYFLMSVFGAGNFILCFHDDGAIVLEVSKSQEDVESLKGSGAETTFSNCLANECSDQDISNPSQIVSAANSIDTDLENSALSQVAFAHHLTPEALAHNGWRSDPPARIGQHYASTLKPTIVLQV